MTESRDWSELDDTLADGPAPADVPAAARPWLAEQRTMHGLLRALCTADATAREGRIAAILARIDADAATGQRRHWLAVAAAALVLAAFGVFWALPDSLPTAEAAMQRAVGELARDVDRRFEIRVRGFDARERETVRHDFDLITRPGNRFLLDARLGYGGLRIVRVRAGCDGERIWVLPENPRQRRDGPLAERERLLEGLGDVLELGYLDVHDLVQKLPRDFELRVTGRVRGDDGREQLRIEATRRRAFALVRLRSAELLVDEPTGMVTSLRAVVELPKGIGRRLEIDYVGPAEPGAAVYRRPW